MSMLSSWFGQQKTQDEDTLDGNGPRPSSSTPIDMHARASTERTKSVFPSALSTPHDAVLSALQTPAPKPGATREDQANLPDIPESVGDIQSRTETFNLRSTTPTSNIAGAPKSTPTELLFDPFDGSVLGVQIPKQEDGANAGSKSHSQLNLPGTSDSFRSAPGPARAGNDAVWTHLTRILEIQSQISKQHFRMEGIGTVKAGDAKRKAHKRATRDLGSEGFRVTPLETPDVGVEEPLVLPSIRSRSRALSNVSTISSPSEGEGDDEGVNVPSEEAEEKRLREEEFEKLANQFEGRKEAINDIMSKLGELSKALSEFHDLPSPNIEFPAPRNPSAPAGPSISPNIVAAESQYLRPSYESSRAQEWLKQSPTPRPSIPRPLQTNPQGDAGEAINLASPPRPQAQKKRPVPTVLISPADPPTQQGSFHDSPASTIGSLKLPPE